jgi:hypothetical protein
VQNNLYTPIKLGKFHLSDTDEELMKVGIICLGQWIHQLIIIDMGIMMGLRKISLLPLRQNLHHLYHPPVLQAR